MGCGALSLHFWGIFHRENVNFLQWQNVQRLFGENFPRGG